MTARRHGDTKAGAVIRRVLGDTKLATPAPRWRQEIAPDVRLLTAGRRRGRGLPARMGAKIGGVKGRLGQSRCAIYAGCGVELYLTLLLLHITPVPIRFRLDLYCFVP